MKLTAEIDDLKSEVELLADNKLEFKTDKNVLMMCAYALWSCQACK